ncbi:hypothetical protein PVK06_017566 [Gossypium arboreum]|uniref:DUF4218 domain-containing protein n=1 Tax=Gossypium arboreum TaxID=29729 RepID=A0ABR0Q3E4_GOSAR|nr:hypothetical protein PVK06_017566 [Gossypium arboreum]
MFCMVLKDIKVPDAYASNISRCVSLKDQRLYSLKSHDYHILMQDLLPVALRCCMLKKVTSCIIELSNIMKAICGKVLNVEELEKVQDRATLTLCNLEKIFPPSFFTIMVHLVIHLPREAIIGGPVFYRWMYPIESKLKSYCRNKRYPEGSIAEGYLAEECMTFCSRYLEDVETRLSRPSRNAGLNDPNLAETYLFQSYEEPIDKVEIAKLDDRSWIQAHRYVLFHHDALEQLRKLFAESFHEWLSQTVWSGNVVNDEVKWLSQGKMPRRRLRDLSIVQNTTNSKEVSTEQQTVVGSSSVPETLDESIEFQTENGGTCRGRGRTLLTDLYNLNSVERVKPVGQEARLLAGYLGIIARNANMLPINYESWYNMPDSNKNQALSNIKERFALEVSDAYIKKALGKKWREHKSSLKKEYFKKPISLEEKLQNVPPGMLRYQWEDADRERVGTSSRQKQKFTHTTGSRSFACVAQAALFDITHRKKDGTPMTSEAAEIMEKQKDKKVEYEATTLTDSSVNFEDIDNRIINEVLGPERYGRVRFQGSGVNPTQYFGSTLHQYMPSRSQSEAEVQRLKDQIVQIQASTDEQISQLRAEAAVREAEQNRKYNELQLQL